jgi:hypothetical protein
MKELNAKLAEVCDYFLGELHYKYGDAGCNDVEPDLGKMLTEDVKDALRPFLDEQDEHLFCVDFCVLSALRRYQAQAILKAKGVEGA